MIATIIIGVPFLLLLILAIVDLMKHGDLVCFIIAIGVAAVLSAMFLTGALEKGYSEDQIRKASIEEALKLGSKFAIHDAIEYNETLREGDNYFFRFTLRPDSDYIDVEYYEAEQNG